MELNNKETIKMLETLSAKQEEMLDVYYKKYLEIGMNSDSVTESGCREHIDNIYSEMGLKAPKIIIVKSPLDAIQLIRSDPKHANFQKICNLEGNHSAGWVGFYDFVLSECGIDFGEEKKIFLAYRELIKNSGWTYLFEKVAIICQRPIVKYIGDGERLLLHNPDGPAIYFPETDKTENCNVWALNDVVVPSWLVETPAEEMDPKMILKEKNTDVQREAIRKFGYDRMLKACNAKIIELWTCPKTGLEYTMRHMEVGEINRRYICYEHASMPGIFYAKCVPPEAENCIQMRGFQTGVVSREDLGNKKMTDEQILKELPETVQ
jgi:hypothetical protein